MSLPPPASPAPPPTLDQDASPQPADAVVAALAERWDLIVRECAIEGRPVLAAALTGRTLSVRDGVLVVGVPLAEAELGQHRRYLLRRLAREVGEQPVAVEALEGRDDPGDDRRRRYLEAESSDRITWLVRHLGAEIIGRELIDRDAWLAHLKAERSG